MNSLQVYFFFWGTASSSVTFQYARPVSDISDGAWLNETGSGIHLYTSIDEVSANDADYIYAPSLSLCEITLGDLSDPGVNTDHIMRYRAKGDGSTDLAVTLRDRNGDTIATWTETNAASTLTTYEHTLTTTQAGNITDYTGLKLTIEAK